jgi:hypothetical protein
MSETTSPGEGPSRPGVWATRAFAAEVGEEPTTSGLRLWQGDLAQPVDSTAKPPLLVSPTPASPVREITPGALPLALVAGAAVALVGGLVWAGVVIGTRYDIGFLAWFVGAATGLTVARVAGGPIGGAVKLSAGLLAAGGIIVGKYVIFVHDVKATIGNLLVAEGLSVGYLDSRQMGIFVHHFGSIVKPIYGLWAVLALVAAVRAADGRRILPARRRSQKS